MGEERGRERRYGSAEYVKGNAAGNGKVKYGPPGAEREGVKQGRESGQSTGRAGAIVKSIGEGVM